MKHKNLAIFIPHLGCPHRCSFCDQHCISGSVHAPSPEEVTALCRNALPSMGDSAHTQIAFFGGSFTALPRDYMLELLEAVQPFLRDGLAGGIRISTRPDYMDRETAALLASYGVTAVELGAQSLWDPVLEVNERGHTARDVYRAAACVRAQGMELGLQMMTGLYGSTPETDLATGRGCIAMKPDTMRIYPTVVLPGTRLARLYAEGAYPMLPLSDMIDLCARLLEECAAAGIRVIRCGLHAQDGVSENRIAGYYHPAFRELCESRRLLRRMQAQINTPEPGHIYVFRVHPAALSRSIGHKGCNRAWFAQQGAVLRLIQDPACGMEECIWEPGASVHRKETLACT